MVEVSAVLSANKPPEHPHGTKFPKPPLAAKDCHAALLLTLPVLSLPGYHGIFPASLRAGQESQHDSITGGLTVEGVSGDGLVKVPCPNQGYSVLPRILSRWF